MGRRGFSLVEFLTVAVLLAVIFAILVPVFIRAREKANQATCLSNMRQMTAALTQYNIENEGYPYCPRTAARGNQHWAQRLVPYMEGVRSFVCPSSDPDKYSLGGVTPPEFAITYGVNEYLVSGPVSEDDLPEPVELAILADSACPWSGSGAVSGERYLWQASPYFGVMVHRAGCLFSFMDGHLQWLPANISKGKGKGYKGNYEGAYWGAVIYQAPEQEQPAPDLPTVPGYPAAPRPTPPAATPPDAPPPRQ